MQKIFIALGASKKPLSSLGPKTLESLADWAYGQASYADRAKIEDLMDALAKKLALKRFNPGSQPISSLIGWPYTNATFYLFYSLKGMPPEKVYIKFKKLMDATVAAEIDKSEKYDAYDRVRDHITGDDSPEALVLRAKWERTLDKARKAAVALRKSMLQALSPALKSLKQGFDASERQEKQKERERQAAIKTRNAKLVKFARKFSTDDKLSRKEVAVLAAFLAVGNLGHCDPIGVKGTTVAYASMEGEKTIDLKHYAGHAEAVVHTLARYVMEEEEGHEAVNAEYRSWKTSLSNKENTRAKLVKIWPDMAYVLAAMDAADVYR